MERCGGPASGPCARPVLQLNIPADIQEPSAGIETTGVKARTGENGIENGSVPP